MKKVMHYSKGPERDLILKNTCCGGFAWTKLGAAKLSYVEQGTTRLRSQVTCGNCKRSKIFKKGSLKASKRSSYSFNSLDLADSMIGGGCLT